MFNTVKQAVDPDTFLTAQLVELWRADPEKALELATASGRRHDALVLRNREEKARDGQDGNTAG